MRYQRSLLTALTVLMVIGLATPSWAIRRTKYGSASHLMGKTKLELGFGVRHHSDPHALSAWDYDGNYASSEGAIGRIALSHFGGKDFAFSMAYTIHDVEHESWEYEDGWDADETTIVHSLMFGMRYYFPQSSPRSAIRPFVSAAAGPVFGTYIYDEEDPCGCETYSETHHTTVTGARLGGGVDFLMGPRWAIGFDAGYNFFEEFEHPIAGRQDYSGSEFGFNIGYLF